MHMCDVYSITRLAVKTIQELMAPIDKRQMDIASSNILL